MVSQRDVSLVHDVRAIEIARYVSAARDDSQTALAKKPFGPTKLLSTLYWPDEVRDGPTG
jgi:hypothetical protein